ncbi:MAG: 2-amino-4-hydroxy-6-hydroxymethyldihydropteridine diphosphokinase [Gammaproteobacteria bacterium]|nr:2-amino-4-hydroxy-6-hydroxymethyldihydropteridine diphosphokinase [Gammaproteobacteria bacterium]
MTSTEVQHWFPAYIGLGSNLDGPAKQLEGSFSSLAEISQTRLLAVSSLYRSAPFGGVEQPDFVNAAAALLTRLSARDLLTALKRIEESRGREQGGVRWGPRVLDLDLLVYSDQQIDSVDLQVPHPGIVDRNFVLLPLMEIAPELHIPGLGRTASLAVNDEPAISRIG